MALRRDEAAFVAINPASVQLDSNQWE
jgi:hypothetical protein